MIHVGVLVPSGGAPPPPPGSRPIERAALALRREGIAVVFGDRVESGRLVGRVPTAEGWQDAHTPVVAVYDRFPSHTRPEAFVALAEGLSAPLANPPSLTALCRDKLACQHFLAVAGIEMPPVVPVAELPHLWEHADAAFLKPRYGSLGYGVRRIVRGERAPATGRGDRDGPPQPLIAQVAVPPPADWAGLSARVLVQRTPTGWFLPPSVARCSREHPVVNVARGADVQPATSLLSAAVHDAMRATARAIAVALAAHPDGHWLVELGVDFAIAADGTPWPIEVNSRPRGRLRVLAERESRYQQAHLDAVARPLRTLAARGG